MTRNMREALVLASHDQLRRVHKPGPGKPRWPAHPATLAALVRGELVERSQIRNRHGWPTDLWTLTDAGREALKPRHVAKRDPVRCLRVPGGSTRMMQLGTWVQVRSPEPEPVSADDVDAAWFGAAAVRHAEARDRREAARRVRRAA